MARSQEALTGALTVINHRNSGNPEQCVITLGTTPQVIRTYVTPPNSYHDNEEKVVLELDNRDKTRINKDKSSKD